MPPFNERKAWWQHLNFVGECRSLRLRLWQCPSFLFIMMGLLDIISMVGTYFIATSYRLEPELVALVVLIVSAAILVVGWTINAAFTEVAQASRLKSEFVSIASHQLRTPLSNIKYALDFILSGRAGIVDEKWKEEFQIVDDSNERMIKLVNNLLDLSRIESGRITLEHKPFSLKREVSTMINEVAPLAAKDGVRIELKAEEEIPEVLTDPGRVRMVMQNFMDNAIKYSERNGQVLVELFTDKGKVFFSVSDHGIGIPKSEQKQVFQKFFRSSNVVKHQTDGTGLGLYIAKAIVEAAGGRVGFVSKEGAGSTFWFALPITKG